MRSFLTALILLTTCAAPAQVGFNSAFYATSQGGQGLGIASGDFNRDGLPDIAVGTNGAVNVYMNLGGGKFGPAVGYAIVGDGSVIQAVDINNDGWLDLVVESVNQTSLTVLLNNGNGSFSNGAPITLTEPSFDLAVGDLRNNGNIDLVVLQCDTTTNNCQFAVFNGAGTGTFTPGTVIDIAGRFVSGLTLADVYEDGKLDIIHTVDAQVQIRRGNGDGTFQAPASLTPPAVCPPDNSTCADSLPSVVVADFNHDAALDIAVLQAHACGSACGNNTVYIYRNNGAGAFTLSSSFTMGPSAGGRLYAGDLNGDQETDLINLNGAHFGGGVVYVIGKGDTTFGTEQSLNTSDNTALVLRDFNLDSRHDLGISSWMGSGWQAFINTTSFTNCANPGSANLAVHICKPANNATLSSPVLVTAGGNSPAGVMRMEVWVDGVKRTQNWSDQIARNVTLASGTHQITVVAVDRYKGVGKTTVTVKVP